MTGFQRQKAQQAIAFFAVREPGIKKLKLIKLIYMSEREAIRAYGEPILLDELYSLPRGPICSETLNMINKGTLMAHIAQGSDDVFPTLQYSNEDLEELSPADLQIYEEVWNKFGGKTASELVAHSHMYFAEWQAPSKNGPRRLPISYATVAEKVHRKDPAGVAASVVEARAIAGLHGKR